MWEMEVLGSQRRIHQNQVKNMRENANTEE